MLSMPRIRFHYAHQKASKNTGKDVWNFPHQREIPYIKKRSSTLPKARVENVQRACANKSTGFGIRSHRQRHAPQSGTISAISPSIEGNKTSILFLQLFDLKVQLSRGESMNASPYIVSNWVEPPHFYGREALSQALAHAPDRCMYVVGTRRVGKTSLLRHVTRLLRPHAIYCDLMQAASQHAGQPSLDESRLVRLLRRELSRLTSEHPALAESRSVWDQPNDELCDWLETASWRWEELGYNLTLLWDEAELLRRLPISTLMRLRALLQQSSSLRLIIGAGKGLATINELWPDHDGSPFLFGFRSFALAGLHDQEADALIRQQGLVQADDEVCAALRQHTGNQPFLLQFLCDRLYQHGQLRPLQASDLLLDPLLADLCRIDAAQLSPSEQHILSQLAQHGPLSTAALQEASQLSFEALASFIAGLQQLGYVRLEAEGWLVGNHFLATWLRNQQALSTSVSDQASMEVVAELAQAETAQQPPNAGLSEREMSVLRLLVAGLRNSEMARELIVSENTIKAHIKHIYRKLGVNDRLAAAKRYAQLRSEQKDD
jgi:DNA-binding CsgD family transcriptional regulator